MIGRNFITKKKQKKLLSIIHELMAIHHAKVSLRTREVNAPIGGSIAIFVW